MILVLAPISAGSVMP